MKSKANFSLRSYQTLHTGVIRHLLLTELNHNPGEAERRFPFLFSGEEQVVSRSFSDPPTLREGQPDAGDECWPAGAKPQPKCARATPTAARRLAPSIPSPPLRPAPHLSRCVTPLCLPVSSFKTLFGPGRQVGDGLGDTLTKQSTTYKPPPAQPSKEPPASRNGSRGITTAGVRAHPD